MNFGIKYSPEAAAQLAGLKNNPAFKKKYNSVKKAIPHMATNLRHPSLNKHEHTRLTKQAGYKVFESYAENKTPGAYRVFWRCGPPREQITIISVLKHPD